MAASGRDLDGCYPLSVIRYQSGVLVLSRARPPCREISKPGPDR